MKRPRNANRLSGHRYLLRAGIISVADSIRPATIDPENESDSALAASRLEQIAGSLSDMGDARRSASTERQEIFDLADEASAVLEAFAELLGFDARQLYRAPIGRYDRNPETNVLRFFAQDHFQEMLLGLSHLCERGLADIFVSEKSRSAALGAAEIAMAFFQQAEIRLRNHDDGPMEIFALLYRAAQLLAPLDRPSGTIGVFMTNAAIDARREYLTLHEIGER